MKVDYRLLLEKKNDKKNIRSVLFHMVVICIILAGVGLLSYPTVANWYNEAHAAKMVADYDNVTKDMSEETAKQMLDAARAYNQHLYEMTDRWAPDEETHEQYNNVLDVTGTGIMAYIEIPKISVKLPVYHGTEETTLMVGIGHHEGSSLPTGSAGDHVVLSGHSALPSARLFTDLAKVEVDDIFYISVLGNKMAYRVREINTVLPEEYEYFGFEKDADLVTLMTCTPYGVNSHRLLVTGERIPDVQDEEDAIQTAVLLEEETAEILNWKIIAVTIPVICIVILFMIKSKRKKR